MLGGNSAKLWGNSTGTVQRKGRNGAILPAGRHSRNLSESRIRAVQTVPQDGVVADITHRKDLLYLIPGNAVGAATARRHPSVLLVHKTNWKAESISAVCHAQNKQYRRKRSGLRCRGVLTAMDLVTVPRSV